MGRAVDHRRRHRALEPHQHLTVQTAPVPLRALLQPSVKSDRNILEREGSGSHGFPFGTIMEPLQITPFLAFAGKRVLAHSDSTRDAFRGLTCGAYSFG